MGVLGVVLMVASVIMMLFTFRKERPVTKLSPLLALVFSLIMLPVYMLLSGSRLTATCAGPLLLVGLVVGFARGAALKLTWKEGKVVGKNSMFFLVGWGASLILAQLLGLLNSALAASLALMPVFLSTGTQVGMHGNIFMRRSRMKEPSATAAPERTLVGQPAVTRRTTSVPPRSTPPRVQAPGAGAPAGAWYLVANSGRGAVRRYRLGERVVIGREADSTIRLDDGRVSRLHAVVSRSEQGYIISDLGSTNGTYVNEARIGMPQQLRVGDSVTVGRTRFEVEAG